MRMGPGEGLRGSVKLDEIAELWIARWHLVVFCFVRNFGELYHDLI